MRAVVTGAAGFVGGHLVDALLSRGDEVIGIDAFTDYYDPAVKRANADRFDGRPDFTLVSGDLVELDLAPLLGGVDVVFHQAARPGVRSSWENFAAYAHDNLVATQRLLESVERVGGARVVFASSSSVYGEADRYPLREGDPTSPRSPYGITKLAGEQLCRSYAAGGSLEVVILRQFTVFGSRQRPDMAFHRMIEAALDGVPFPLYGTGSQRRDFTHVRDIVDANLAAAEVAIGADNIFNVAGGASATVSETITLIEGLVGRPIRLDRRDQQRGDVNRNDASIERAADVLRWRPVVGLAEGLAEQVEWHRGRRP